MRKARLIFIVIIFVNFSISGCWSSKEINTLGIVTAIGVDKCPEGYKVTIQILNAKAVASKEPITESPVIVIEQEGESISQAVRRMTNLSSRKVYMSHIRTIVIGEDIAREGISGILDYLIRNEDLRTDYFFVEAKGDTAHRVLDIITPLETIPANKIIDSLKESKISWAPTKTVRIIELMNAIIAEGKEPVITAVEIIGKEYEAHTTDIMKQIHPEERIKLSGMSVYKRDKLVGYLDEDESKGYNYITDNVTRTIGQLQFEDGYVGLEINKVRSKQKAYLIDNKPAIKTIIELEANINVVECNIDVTKEENIRMLEKKAAERGKEICMKALRKAQEELQSDIFGFGNTIHKRYPKIWKEVKNNWDSEFTRLPVDIQVSVEIKGLGTASKPFFLKEEE